MFKKLVVAVDQSAVSRALVEAVGHMAPLGTREVLLLHCVTIKDLTSISLSYTLEYLDRNLKELKTELLRHGLDVKTRIVPGSAQRNIPCGHRRRVRRDRGGCEEARRRRAAFRRAGA